MKTYSDPSDDLTLTLKRMQSEFHPDLRGVNVGALFVFDEDKDEQVLKHQGYPAAAVVKITALRDRALGIADAIITVDRVYWQTLTAPQKNALIDHELEHLDRVVDPETDKPKRDALGRPKLRMRRHSHQIGFFTDILKRHGENAVEAKMVHALMRDASQLAFDFLPAGIDRAEIMSTAELTEASVGAARRHAAQEAH